MKEVMKFLKDSGIFYLASLDKDNQPRNRPFGAVCEFEGKLYVITNNKKDVFKQLMENNKVEIAAVVGENWLRLQGSLIHDSRREARLVMLEENKEALSALYSVDDGLMEVLYFENAKATFYSFTTEPRTIEF